MSIIGKTLAHYEITSQLGKGGMGEVYQGKDRKLGREVAIKILPEEFARDVDRVARFQREAKLLASLNHPNIAAIYGLEESDGRHFLVLELVEGETLADRLKRGPIPVEESLKLAFQIAEALEAAHEKGVIHRDLKPANIKVTPEGKVKVLDFGLAKAYAGDKEEVNLSNSPTLSDAATQQGVILGTSAYMSPEQAKGKTVDKRADIWAFGVVLFEMLTGRQLFTGETVSETLAAVLMREPDFSILPPNLHPRIRFLLERCLEKEPRNRYHDISEVRLDIQKVLSDRSGVLMQLAPGIAPRTMLRKMAPWIVAAILFGAIITGIAVWEIRTPEPSQIMRFDYELPAGQQFSDTTMPVFAVSPDGKKFVYAATSGLYLRSWGELTAKLISGTEGGPTQPFFSPDGKWVGYCSRGEGQIKKIAINGGAPVTLVAASSFLGADWNANDTIVFGTLGGILRISANGGAPEFLYKAEGQLIASPQILPGGKSVLFTNISSSPFRVIVQSLKSRERKELFAGDTARYLPTGQIVYASENNILAVRFDLDRLETVGGPAPVVEGVTHLIAPLYAVSDSGTLVYVPAVTSAVTSGRTFVWVTRDGREEPIEAPPNDYMYPKISPDGTRVALTLSVENNWDIWIWDLVRKTMTRLTFDKSYDVQPVWTPDGKRIVFASTREGNLGLYWKAADGTGKDEKIFRALDRNLMPYSWSSDGKILIVAEVEGNVMASNKWYIGMLSMEGERSLKTLLKEEYVEIQPQISPDGRWIAYSSNESGPNQGQIYVRPFPEVDKGKWQVSTNGGSCPRWSPDGRELFYLSRENSLMAVPVETKPALSFGVPRSMFRSIYAGLSSSSGTPWDISPDGKRFLMMKEPGNNAAKEAGPRKINVVVNWFEELKQRVPVK
jgi:Tol biopolymer transport system component